MPWLLNTLWVYWFCYVRQQMSEQLISHYCTIILSNCTALIMTSIRIWCWHVFCNHQGLQQYAACQSSAFMKGTGTFLLGNVEPKPRMGLLTTDVSSLLYICIWKITSVLSCIIPGTAGFFVLQKALQKRLPYALQWNLLVSFGKKCMKKEGGEHTGMKP